MKIEKVSSSVENTNKAPKCTVLSRRSQDNFSLSIVFKAHQRDTCFQERLKKAKHLPANKYLQKHF